MSTAATDASADPVTAHTALVHHLGGEACVVPVPAESDGPLTEVGTLAGLPVWSLGGTARDLSTVARRLARRGRIGVLLADDPAHHRRLVAVTVDPVRTATFPLAVPDALPLLRLAAAARRPAATLLEQALAFADAVDLDAAGRRTFRLLHQLIANAVDTLPTRVSADERRAWALIQLTRLLFLRFVESEGWLDGNRRFLAEQLDRCLRARRDPTRHLLHPLFFGTLNRAWIERSRFARAFGAVPFLNGGLFEPHPVERHHKFHLPAAFWIEAFTALVDRVDVTLDAADRAGRVTPELLGRVFEGVMDPDERHDGGTFFTPPALVDEVLRHTLAAHLALRTGRRESDIHDTLDAPDRQLQRLLLDITVLDPAAGSGAFLVGALGLLHGPGPRRPARVRHLVQRRLFGVDRHPGAVRLAELRLWLEVLRAWRGSDAGALPPLPNLDVTIRAGDALLDPVGETSLAVKAARRIGVPQRDVAGSRGAAKRSALASARAAEREVMVAILVEREHAVERRIALELERARQPRLFGGRPPLDAAARRRLREWRADRRDLRRQRRLVLRDASAEPFALGVAFAATMARRGGFDLVVGNPPWVRAERIAPAVRQQLGARYRWWRGGSGRGWRHLPDLSVAFVERGCRLLAPGGTLALLVPAKLATAGYASACRAGLAAQTTVHVVADLADDPLASFDATAYPLVLIASRTAPPAEHEVRLALPSNAPRQPQHAWRRATRWTLAAPAEQQLVARLREAYPTLAEAVTLQLGVKTGANSVFVDPPMSLEPWCRPAVRGRDVKPFRATPGARLLWPADARGNPLATLPRFVAEYLAQHDAALRRRADYHGGPLWQLFRTHAATAPFRVVWRDLARELTAAVLDDPDAVPLNSCYVAAMPSADRALALAAWLNCRWIRRIARLAAEPAQGGCARFGARATGSVPLPAGVLADRMLIELAREGARRDVQQELDERTAELLGLDAVDCELLER